MKYTISIPKDRILSATHDDEGFDVAAGAPMAADAAPSVGDSPVAERQATEEHLAFSVLIELLRRKERLTVGELADRACVDLAELVRVLNDVRYSPSPRTVYQLAQFFSLPERKLLELSKLAVPRNTKLQSAAVQFAANATHLDELNSAEEHALNAFVEFLGVEQEASE